MDKGIHSDLRAVQIVEALRPFGAGVSEVQVSQILQYVRLLVKWNETISLTTVVDPVEIVARHFGESLFAKKLLPVENGRLADVGSGAGFPGLALKIFCPDLHVTLIESNKKKAAFLAEIIRTLDLKGVSADSRRFEEIPVPEPRFDFVTARALGGFPNLLRWARRVLSPEGQLVLWVGGEDTTGLTNIEGWYWNPPELIPESQRRFIMAGRYVGDLEEKRRISL
jgi:16S rRNA (guanine527-N7)-methyltransferase